MRIGVPLAVSILVLAFIVVSAVGVHLLWWRTAEEISQTLAATINEQIVSAVGDELQSIKTEARSAFTATRTLLIRHALDIRESSKREFVFMSQLQSQPTISWVGPYGRGLAAHRMRNFTAAIEHFEDVLQARPLDKPSMIMIERSHQYLRSPPPDDWKGVTTALTK